MGQNYNTAGCNYKSKNLNHLKYLSITFQLYLKTCTCGFFRKV